MGIDRFVVSQFGQNILGQLLAELNAPLIETENVPDHSLGEYFMLIQGNYAPQFFQQKFLDSRLRGNDKFGMKKLTDH